MSVYIDHELVIIGTGFSGIGMSIAARRSGREFVIFEKTTEIGGTWRDNHYPGCSCDVPSHLYSFSFEHNPYWSRAYANANEIQDYLLFCVEKYGIRNHISFDSAIQRMTYDEGLGVWHLTVTSSSGEVRQVVARVVVLGVGTLHDPTLPDTLGLEKFGGKLMHTALWDVDISMFGKRVGVIGTGCSAVQAIPYLAEDAKHLTIFQRTPVWVLPKFNPEFPEWLIDAYEKWPWLMKTHRMKIKTYNEFRSLAFTKQPLLLKTASNIALAHMHRAIKDPTLRAKLTPNYTMGCKRITMSNTYFPTLARDNVTIETSNIISANATELITVNATHHALDIVVLATGFNIAGSYRHLDVTGQNGHILADDWDAGINSFYGVTVPHYPNLFLLRGPNTGLGHTSVLLMIEAQIGLITKLLDERDKRRATVVVVRQQVVPAHMKQLDERSASTVWKIGGCHSWYLEKDGRNRSLWPASVTEYEHRLAKPDLVDYEFTGAV